MESVLYVFIRLRNYYKDETNNFSYKSHACSSDGSNNEFCILPDGYHDGARGRDNK